MALTEITYTNKETLNEQPSIADKNKVKADDMNEIKSVVNTNAGKVGDLANLDTTSTSSIVAAINEVKGQLKTTEVYNGTPTLYTSEGDSRNVITVNAVSGTVLMYFLTYAWPRENWNNGAIVELGAMFPQTNKVYLKTTSQQSYNIQISALYIE